MDSNDYSFGRLVNHLATADSAQIYFAKLPPDNVVLNGKAVFSINSEVRFEINIPEQEPEQHDDELLLFVRDLSGVFIDFKK